MRASLSSFGHAILPDLHTRLFGNRRQRSETMPSITTFTQRQTDTFSCVRYAGTGHDKRRSVRLNGRSTASGKASNLARMAKKRKRTPKSIQKLPDFEQSKSAVLNSLASVSSQ